MPRRSEAAARSRAARVAYNASGGKWRGREQGWGPNCTATIRTQRARSRISIHTDIHVRGLVKEAGGYGAGKNGAKLLLAHISGTAHCVVF